MPKFTSKDQQKRFLAQWRSSEQSQAGFTRSIGIPNSTIATWARNYPPQTSAVTASSDFIDVTPEPSPPPPFAIRLGFHNSAPLDLVFDAPPSPTWFAAVLCGLEE